MKIPVYNLTDQVVGETEVADEIFARPWNPDLVEQALRVQVANRRKPIADTKGRGEVSGGGRKPWRQKGTGRARHGSIRSPLWRGGGVSHGPHAETQFAKRLPKRMLRAAIHAALSKKLSENDLKVIEGLRIAAPKTKELARTLKVFASSALLIPGEAHSSLYRAARNLPRVKALAPEALNVYDIMRYRAILIDRAALSLIR